MIKRLNLVTAFIIGLTLQAQNHIDALRYSQESLWGSARYVAMGGAFGALGSNGSTASFNPAGIATFTNGQFSGSFNLNQFDSDGFESTSGFNSPASFAKRNTASIPNLNYVSANILSPDESGDWDRVNFGIGFNKLDDYNKYTYLEGTNSENSLGSFILNNAEGNSFDNLSTLEQLAFNTYLIDTIGSASTYTGATQSITNRTQSYRSRTSGSKNEFYVSFGTAYQKKLFLGATLGFPSIKYRERTNITESNFEGTNDGLESFNYASDLYVEGAGINLKLGLIYKIDDAIRYGFALHTPTYYEIHEEYSSSMQTNFANDTTFDAGTYLGLFDYELSTPFKIINSLSFVLNKRAIISIEHEYLDYSSAQLNAEYYAFVEENETIDIAYSSTSNVRIGSELRVHPQLSVRGGYAYYGSPFTNTNNDSSTEFLTFGFGLQVNQYFFDFALISSYNNSNLSLYSGSEEARLSNRNEQIVISGGFKF